MEVIPMNAALGAEVRCGDLRKLDDAARAPDVKVITGLLLGSPEFQRR